ncbi:MAG: DUF6491 family protein [Pseudomonadota bacterium]
MTELKALVPIAILAATAACASNQGADEGPEPGGADDPRRGETVRSICFRSTINNFSVIARDKVVLTRGVNDQYLVELAGGCDARDAFTSIGVGGRGGGSCVTKFDDILLDRSVAGPRRCQIREIYDWDPDADVEEDEAPDPDA